jgi:hypothetical protein
MSIADRKAFEAKTGASYALLPTDAHGLPLVSASSLGQSVYSGKIWTLVKLSS